MTDWNQAQVSEAERSYQDDFIAKNGYEIDRPLSALSTAELESMSRKLMDGTMDERRHQVFVVLPELERRWSRE